MPIYEYTCEDCNTSFEYLVMGGKGPEACPKCKGKKIRQMISACGFVSKNGSGQTTSTSASTSSCTGCTAGSCAGCH
jgi:putative FmdB family regulatory protein